MVVLVQVDFLSLPHEFDELPNVEVEALVAVVPLEVEVTVEELPSSLEFQECRSLASV